MRYVVSVTNVQKDILIIEMMISTTIQFLLI